MKQICILAFGILSYTVVTSQNIEIPDPVFKTKLLAMGVDNNDDGEIQQSEALLVDEMNLTG